MVEPKHLIHWEAKAGKTKKELDLYHKTRFKGNCHVLGVSTRVLPTEKTGSVSLI